jgi:2-keto-4-pentenoate hydratase/2-oxohepta-3-ene-1,7-dioic acid hydratase in catechol pathway
MKLLRCGPKGAEKPCILAADGTVRDLSGRVPDFAGAAVSFAALDAIRRIDPMSLPVVPAGTRIGACLADVPNFHCIGLNYARHAAETGAKAPPEPILFNKATSTLAGPNDPVVIPKDSVKSDWEVELGVVLGRDVEHVSEAEALACVSAYCIVNDLSEREWQMERAGQWTKGKSAPGFGPTGPWLVTADEVPDPQALDLWLELNGTKVQNSSTSDMIFTVAQIIASMSRYMRLRTGDLICTGTPEGVGLGMKPPRYLVPGDRMRLGIAGLGVQEQAVVAWGG